MLLTIVFGPSAGASVETNATSSVLAATANAGLAITVSGPAVRETVVAIVGAVPSDTTMATALPAGASEPPVGVWLITLPAATVLLAAVVTVTVKPAPVSDAVAAACVCPTTFGTATAGGPLETTRATDDPTSTVVAAAGLWLMTMPEATVVLLANVIGAPTRPASLSAFSASPCVPMEPNGAPTTSGTMVPSEITRSTGEFGGSVKPARGSDEITRPIGIVGLLADVTTPTRRPAVTIAVVASASVRPTTPGTVLSGFGTGIVMSENCSCSMLRSVSIPSDMTAMAARVGT